MEILLRKTTDPDRPVRVYACDPETGQALTRIENPAVWCDTGDESTAYDYPEGIYWLTMQAAINALRGPHTVVYDDGDEPPQVFTIRLPAGLHEQLRDAAHERRRSMADIVREAIETSLN